MTTYEKIYNHQKKSCFYCKEKTEFNMMEREHVFPKSKGGKGIKNKVLSCHYCNSLKSNLTVEEFIVKVKKLLKDENNPTEKLLNILITLEILNKGTQIRNGWHKNASYKSININDVPTRKI